MLDGDVVRGAWFVVRELLIDLDEQMPSHRFDNLTAAKVQQ